MLHILLTVLSEPDPWYTCFSEESWECTENQESFLPWLAAHCEALDRPELIFDGAFYYKLHGFYLGLGQDFETLLLQQGLIRFLTLDDEFRFARKSSQRVANDG